MPSNTRPVTVGTTLIRAVNYDKNRTSLVIYNLGATTVFYGVNPETTAAQGIPVPSGSPVIFSIDFGDDPRVERFLIAAAGSNDVRIGEEWLEAKLRVKT